MHRITPIKVLALEAAILQTANRMISSPDTSLEYNERCTASTSLPCAKVPHAGTLIEVWSWINGRHVILIKNFKNLLKPARISAETCNTKRQPEICHSI